MRPKVRGYYGIFEVGWEEGSRFLADPRPPAVSCSDKRVYGVLHWDKNSNTVREPPTIIQYMIPSMVMRLRSINNAAWKEGFDFNKDSYDLRIWYTENEKVSLWILCHIVGPAATIGISSHISNSFMSQYELGLSSCQRQHSIPYADTRWVATSDADTSVHHMKAAKALVSFSKSHLDHK